MALTMDFYQPQYEVTIAGCYWKIEVDRGIEGGKTKIRARMNCFKDKATADTNQNKYSDFDFDFVPDLSVGAANFIAQAYAYAKTLPEFATAIDA
jgi:hypothetical protein